MRKQSTEKKKHPFYNIGIRVCIIISQHGICFSSSLRCEYAVSPFPVYGLKHEIQNTGWWKAGWTLCCMLAATPSLAIASQKGLDNSLPILEVHEGHC